MVHVTTTAGGCQGGRTYDVLVWVPWLASELAECVLLGLLVWVLSWWLPLVWALLG